ncbi:MAG: hypothetical protein WA958_18155 [Tunicatimonas sp.]
MHIAAGTSKQYGEINELDITKTQEKSYLITSDQVGLFTRQMTIGEIIKLLPKNQVQKKIGYGEFPDDTYDDYEIYDNVGSHLLTVTPKIQNDLTSKINRVLIVSPQYQTKEGIGLNSTYSDLLASYSIKDYAPTIKHITLTVDSLNAWFNVSKAELEAGWWDEEKKEVDRTKISPDAVFDSIAIWWH